MTAQTEPLPPVADLLPHSGQMVLLDQLLSYQKDRAITEVTLTEDTLFLRNGRIRGIVTLEYMAQTVGSFVGMVDRHFGRNIEIGFLIGIRQMQLFESYFHVGDRLEIEAIHVWGDAKLGSFKAHVKKEDRIVAQATLTVFRGEIPEGAL